MTGAYPVLKLLALYLALTAAVQGHDHLGPVPEAPSPPTVSDVSPTTAIVHWHSPTNYGPQFSGYELQYKKTWEDEWHSVGEKPGVETWSTREVQLITLRSDEGEYIDGGTFRLSFNYEGVNDLDFVTKSQTDRLPFNATAMQLKTALESLSKINLVEVRRFGPHDNGGYSWKVTLDWDLNFRGDLPMLVASEERFDVTWSGSGGVVLIKEEQKGFIGEKVCYTTCQHEVLGLEPETRYHFRVRAENAKGYGQFSGISSPIMTLKLGPPLRAYTPSVSSVGADSITVAVEVPPANGMDPSELLIEVQVRPAAAARSRGEALTVGWTTLEGARVWHDDEKAVVVTATGLRPLTAYELRARAVSPLGPGLWSASTAPVKTRPNPPEPPLVHQPQQADIKDTHVLLRWTAELPVYREATFRPIDLATENPPIEAFDVEYRVSGDRWIRVANGVPSVASDYENAVPPIREIQEVRTRTEADPIASGAFRLGFQYNPQTHSLTDPLPFDATAELVQAELSSLEGLGPVHVTRYGPDDTGGYTYRVTFDWNQRPSLFRGDIPALFADAFTLNASWPLADGGPVFVREVRKGRVAGYKGEEARSAEPRTSSSDLRVVHPVADLAEEAAVVFNFTVGDLKPITLYQFRVRSVSALGAGPWSEATARIRTQSPHLPSKDSFPPFNASSGVGLGLDGVGEEVKHRFPATLSTNEGEGFDEFLNYLSPLQGQALVLAKEKGARIIGGKGRQPGLGLGEPDYLSGVAVGGEPGQDGGPGLVVIRYYVHNQPTPSVAVFSYQDPKEYGEEPQLYVVPPSPVAGVVTSHVDIKAWGGGGGGGSTRYGVGGAGSFVALRLAVREGDVLAIRVGGGGGGVTGGNGGRGGYNGGGAGGYGDAGGGGGGGASTVHLLLPEGDERAVMGAPQLSAVIPVIAAAGGGGGGSTDYCCGHGGAGAGAGDHKGTGAPGSFPHSTPRDASLDPSLYRYGNDSFGDERDREGLPPYHEHLDLGYAPNSNISLPADPGSGGTVYAGGNPGSNDAYQTLMGVDFHGRIRPYVEIYGDTLTGRSEYGFDEAGEDMQHVRERREGGAYSPGSPYTEGAYDSHQSAFSTADYSQTMRRPTSGRWGMGGAGGSGKEGGGGGGGGLFGGGGGGAGIDAAGGGGGASYIHGPALYTPPLDSPLPPTPTAVGINSVSVALTWPVVYWTPTRQPSAGYVLELASGKVSDEFTEVWAGDGATTLYVVGDLTPSTTYRVRLRALSHVTGPSEPSAPLVFTTTTPLRNVWRYVVPYTVGQARAGGGRRYVDPPSFARSLLPSSLQGATFTEVGGYLYMFGGRSEGFDCDLGIARRCRHYAGVSNQTWRLDPVTYTWLQVPVSGYLLPRERHAAANIGGKLYVFGGRSHWRADTASAGDGEMAGSGLGDLPGESIDFDNVNGEWTGINDAEGDGGPYLNDVWSLNFGQERNIVMEGSLESSLGVTLGPDEAIPEGNINFFDLNLESDPDECIDSVEVFVELAHQCLKELEVKLYGPGPEPFRSKGSGFGLSKEMPLNQPRGESTLLFSGGFGRGTARNTIPCVWEEELENGGVLSADGKLRSKNVTVGPLPGLSMEDGARGRITFADSAPREWAECCDPVADAREKEVRSGGMLFVHSEYTLLHNVQAQRSVGRAWMNGEYRPVDTLSRYRGLPPAGLWRLSILDRDTNGVQGKLVKWGINVRVAPCARPYEWDQAQVTGDAPDPRMDTTGVVVGRSWFIFGGRNDGSLDDLWRFDIDTSTWTLLPQPSSPKVVSPDRYLGRVGVISPWGILAWGGRAPTAHHLAQPVVWRWDPTANRWHSVSPPFTTDPRLSELSAYTDSNFGAGEEHLDKDYAPSAEAGLNTISGPPPRYPSRRLLPAMSIVGTIGSNTQTRGVASPKLVVYGGYDGARQVEDLWEFNLNQVWQEDEVEVAAYSEAQSTGITRGSPFEVGGIDRASLPSGNGYGYGDLGPPGGRTAGELWEATCPWRLREDSTTYQNWENGCMGNGTMACRFREVLVWAWCTRTYQSIGVVQTTY